MSFWENVDVELEYLGMNRTALANAAGFSISNIGKGIQKGSSPSADTAVKIAKILGVSVEYLVTGSNSSQAKCEDSNAIQKYHKHANLIEEFEKLPEYERESILVMIKMLNEKRENSEAKRQ